MALKKVILFVYYFLQNIVDEGVNELLKTNSVVLLRKPGRLKRNKFCGL